MTNTRPSDQIWDEISYDPNTGHFKRLKSHMRSLVGGRADQLSNMGYYRVKFKTKHYSAHRLAWLFTYGEWPVDCVDHIDGNRQNNSITNLRIATTAQNRMNSQNRGPCLKGVTRCKRTGKFVAQIKASGVKRTIGRFATEQEAHSAYLAAAEMHFGEFARAA